MNAPVAMREGLSQGTRFLAEGEGAPLVLIHGVGMDLSMWDEVAKHLARERRVIRYDMLGHGRSAKPRGPYRLADFVAQLARLADELHLSCFDLLGFSMGGLVAQGMALAHGERVDRLILLNTVYDRSPGERAAIAARLREVETGGYRTSVEAALDRWFTPAFREAQAETVEAVRRHMLANDLDAYAAAYAVFATADEELAGQVHRIRHPTLIVTGAEDQRSTPAMARALAARLPRGRAEVIEGQRHMTPLEIPSRLAALVTAFLEPAANASLGAIAP
jgi:3-oxoadipate enol-lactonase